MLFKRREEHDRAYLRLPGTMIFLPSCKTQLISCQKRGQSYSIKVVRKIKRSYNRIFHNHEFLTERPRNPSRELMPCMGTPIQGIYSKNQNGIPQQIFQVNHNKPRENKIILRLTCQFWMPITVTDMRACIR